MIIAGYLPFFIEKTVNLFQVLTVEVLIDHEVELGKKVSCKEHKIINSSKNIMVNLYFGAKFLQLKFYDIFYCPFAKATIKSFFYF